MIKSAVTEQGMRLKTTPHKLYTVFVKNQPHIAMIKFMIFIFIVFKVCIITLQTIFIHSFKRKIGFNSNTLIQILTSVQL